MNDRIEDDAAEPTPRWRVLADAYHRPPPAPREEIWARIAAELETPQAVRSPRLRWIQQGAAAAALVALGFGLGRSVRPQGPALGGVASEPPATERAFRSAAAEHLAESEALLTLVRLDADAGRVEAGVAERTRALLAQTRLLLDSPAGLDPALKPVLEDLELILAQICVAGSAEVAGARRNEELRLIAEGLDAQEMLPRIQAVLPALKGS